ncbi:MAG TPA: hypothetical protein PLZ79_09270, partial [Burkholderiales bacterium]|nr:hypothetical protein [Burkholderiales bacterium]
GGPIVREGLRRFAQRSRLTFVAREIREMSGDRLPRQGIAPVRNAREEVQQGGDRQLGMVGIFQGKRIRVVHAFASDALGVVLDHLLHLDGEGNLSVIGTRVTRATLLN